MREVLVPTATNDGSAFANHVVLIWTAGTHTYPIGFHDLHGIEATLALDIAIVRGIKLVSVRKRLGTSDSRQRRDPLDVTAAGCRTGAVSA